MRFEKQGWLRRNSEEWKEFEFYNESGFREAILKRREAMLQETRRVMSKFGVGLMLVLLVGILSLAQDVTSDSMPGVDFSKYRTYKWVPIEGAVKPNQIVDVQIKQSIDSQLATKGLTKTDGEKADLLVGYQVSIDQQKQWNAYGTGGGLRWGGGMASAQQSTISTGTLVLDMYDPSTKQLVWTGRVSKTLDPSANEGKKQKNLDKAMQKLLKNYPPNQK